MPFRSPASEQHATQVARVAAGLTAAVSVVGIVASLNAARPLVFGTMQLPPIALWASTSLLLLGGGVAACAGRPPRSAVRGLCIVVALAILVAAILTQLAEFTGSSFDIERLPPFSLLTAGPVPPSRSTTPLAAPLFVAASVALLLLALNRRRAVVGILAMVPLLVGLFIILGFLYRAPLFGALSWRPVSVLAGGSSIALAVALISAAGPRSWPLRHFTGGSVRSQLTRWFLPFTVLTVVFTNLVFVRLFSSISPALGLVINVGLSIGAAGAMTYYLSLTIGGRIDRAEEEAARITRLYEVLSRINVLITRVTDRDTLLHEASRIAVEDGGFLMAWVGVVDPATHLVRPIASSGAPLDYLDRIRISVDDIPEGQGPTGIAIRERRIVVCGDIAAEVSMGPWREEALLAGFMASGAFPLTTLDVVTHVFSFYAEEAGWFNAAEVRLLEELASDLSYALGALRREQQRTEAEAQIAASEEQFRALVENSSDLIAILDPVGITRYVSPSIKRVLGFDPAERIGRSLFDLLHPDDVPQVQQALVLVDPTARIGPLICRLRSKSGSWRTVEAVGWNMLSVRGVTGIVVHTRDVTDRQALEAQLRQAQKMETVGQLSSGIAHDFNNLLTVIMANTDLLAGTVPASMAVRQEAIDDIQGATARGRAMVRQLMGFSRITTLELRPTDLNQLIRRVAVMLRRVLPGSVILDVAELAELPLIVADPGAVEQMVLNLATNARDAMPGGGHLGLEVRLARPEELRPTDERQAQPADHVALAVRDNGAGMDAETVARIFEPFFTTKPIGRGTGLGMAMLDGLMREHGGYVSIASAPGRGTTVTLFFRIAVGIERPALIAEAAAPVASASEAPCQGTVLVVEDEEPLRRVAQRILERAGYRVLLAEDGSAAMRWLREPGIVVDLIFTDMTMPNVNGAELYRLVAGEIGPMRFLVASGNILPEDGTGGMPTTIPFLLKPWDRGRLLEAVASAMGRGG